MSIHMNNRDYHKLMALLVEIRDTQRLLLERQYEMAKTLDDIVAEVEEESTTLDSLASFVAGLKQQITDALAGTTLPPPVQAKIEAVFAGIESNKAKLAKAMEANVT